MIKEILFLILLMSIPTLSTANTTNTVGSIGECIPQGPRVALTFDDGPHKGKTGEVLDILDRHGQVATFFLVGKMVRAYPDVALDIYNRGHEIAVHTDHHHDLSKLPSHQQEAEIENGYSSMLQAVPNANISYWRAPYGATPYPMPASASKLGLKHMLWTLDTNDWRKPGAQLVYDRVINGVKDKTVVLMHDATQDTRSSLEAIVVALLDKGYQLVRLSDMSLPSCAAPIYAQSQPSATQILISSEKKAIIEIEPRSQYDLGDGLDDGMIYQDGYANAKDESSGVIIIAQPDTLDASHKGPTLEDYNKQYGPTQ